MTLSRFSTGNSHLPRRMGKDWGESNILPSTPAPSLEGDTNISYGDTSVVPNTSWDMVAVLPTFSGSFVFGSFAPVSCNVYVSPYCVFAIIISLEFSSLPFLWKQRLFPHVACENTLATSTRDSSSLSPLPPAPKTKWSSQVGKF